MANFTAIPFLNEKCSYMVTVNEDRIFTIFKTIYELVRIEKLTLSNCVLVGIFSVKKELYCCCNRIKMQQQRNEVPLLTQTR